MKFKVGDRVLVRSDLVVNEQYGNDTVIDSMVQYIGKVITIDHVGASKYQARETGWVSWTPEMLEGPAKKYLPKSFKLDTLDNLDLSRAMQRRLFELGVSWELNKTDVMDYATRFLFVGTYKDMCLTHGGADRRPELEFFTLNDLYTLEFEPEPELPELKLTEITFTCEQGIVQAGEFRCPVEKFVEVLKMGLPRIEIGNQRIHSESFRLGSVLLGRTELEQAIAWAQDLIPAKAELSAIPF